MLLRTLSGIGALVIGEARYEGIRYTIRVSASGGVRRGDGVAICNSPRDLVLAFNAAGGILELSDRGTVAIVFTSMTIPSNPPHAEFVTSGTIPGF